MSSKYTILELSKDLYYVKDVDNNRIVSGILSFKEAKKKKQVLELDKMMDDIIEKNGSLGLPTFTIQHPTKF